MFSKSWSGSIPSISFSHSLSFSTLSLAIVVKSSYRPCSLGLQKWTHNISITQVTTLGDYNYYDYSSPQRMTELYEQVGLA